MSYFLSKVPLQIGTTLELTDDEARHILLSRRIEVGEMIEIQDPAGKRFEAKVIDIDRKSLSIQAISEIKTPKESPLKITVFQALIKEQPLDNIIQKLTELGVDYLVLFYSENSVERFKEIEKKLVRWRKISEEAAKQSGRVKSANIEFIDSFENLKSMNESLEQIFILDPNSIQTFSTWGLRSQVNKIGILVGPEGGFTATELEQFSSLRNVMPTNLGPRILRADTAAIASAAITQSLWGDMN
ncbi:MAG: 16S rRNA (uracil(1498)-N(3))-methyltransferase [Candidatus Vogelbacteria bacterium]|nr:16S rRNA (uracil(1498)-N(3))-methyltransferase [Candidatus Vogelbacteria bacterium]